MTIKVTISNDEPQGGRTVIVTQSAGTGTEIEPGQSAYFFVHAGNALAVVESAAKAEPQGGGGTGPRRDEK